MSTLFDTNIWLYAFLADQDSQKRSIALTMIDDKEPVLSVQIVNEICANLLRKAKLPEGQLRTIIEALYQRYTVHNLDRPILLLATELRTEYRLSFWDGLVVATAIRNGISTVFSEDMHHGLVVRGQTTIKNPFLGNV